MSALGQPLFAIVGAIPPFDQWARQGRIPACVNADPEAFFPPKGGDPRPARELCADCPVAVPCLQWALDNDQRFGIWGGTTERQRRRLRRQTEREVAA